MLSLLNENAHCASQWVLEEMESKAEISDYLIAKMKTIKETGHSVSAELGNTQSGDAGRDCVCMAQGGKQEIEAVVLFKIEGNKIGRFDLCMPALLNTERTGVYPI